MGGSFVVGLAALTVEVLLTEASGVEKYDINTEWMAVCCIALLVFYCNDSFL